MHTARPAARWIAVTGTVVAVALAVVGCTSTTSSGSAKSGGTAVVGMTTDVLSLDPWKATQFQDVYDVLPQIYGTLTEFDKDMNVVPGLATKWDTSADGKTVTFHLRTGVTYQDGQAFSSKDVVASLTAIKDPKTAAVGAATLANVASIAAPDANTVVLTMSAPDASLFAGLASINTAILSAKDTEASVAKKPDGTGAYTFSTRKPGSSLTLVANKHYWRGAPTLGTVEFRVIPEEQSIVSAMQAGNVQVAAIDDPVVAKTAGSSLNVTKTPQLSYHVLQLNARHSAVSDLDVRLAIQCAVDRKGVLDTADLGAGEVTGPITSPAYKSDPGDQPCATQDLAKAKQYLAAAGKKTVTLDTIVGQGEYSSAVNEAQALKSQLAKAGIELKLEILDNNTYVSRWVAGTFDAAVALNGGNPDPGTMYGRYFTTKGNLNAVAGYATPALDTLFAQGQATTDLAQRKAIYAKISENLVDNAAWVWLFTSDDFTVTTKSVTGFTPMANGSLQFLRSTKVAG